MSSGEGFIPQGTTDVAAERRHIQFSQQFDPKEERLRYICHLMARQGVIDWAARTGLKVEPRRP